MSEGHAPPFSAATLLARQPSLATLAALEGLARAYSADTSRLLAALLENGRPQQVVADQAAYALLQPAQQQLLAQAAPLTLLDTCDLAAVAQALTLGGLLYTTTLQEPFQTVPDLTALGQLARQHGAALLIDGTQSPLLQPALLPALAANVLHRHAGLLLGNDHQQNDCGTLLSAIPLAQLGNIEDSTIWPALGSLPARLRLHSAHAQAVADVLTGHPQVRAVYHPGLGTHPQFEQAAETFPEGFGGRLALEVRHAHFGERLGRFWRQQPGFGTTYSTFQRHHSGVWQLWLGLEDIAELLAELEAALE